MSNLSVHQTGVSPRLTPAGDFFVKCQQYPRDMEFIYPDIDWYTEISEQKKATPRCPYANVHRCPRYFSSLYLLGEEGVTTKIKPEKVKELDEFWEKSDLLPVVA